MLTRIKLVVVLCLMPVLLYAGDISFESKDIAGNQHKLSDYRGKWVIVNYWATWCPPCLDEIPELIEYHEAYQKDQAVVLGVNYEETDDRDLKMFVDEYFISYPILRGDTSRPPPFGRLLGLPTTYVISPQGALIATKIGGVTKAWLEKVTKIKPVTSKVKIGSNP